ncbi:hypothetical protein NDU88_001376 [Pleurodeles waltl]|uniref:Uncharacterized protein n=1 Tax=Pleurodeles waltl TaxID=8319 RepID=A0AAV7WLS2_PLEWA|nr:hypothetical protein NDU88_001376 [Pleurodeles waltl]
MMGQERQNPCMGRVAGDPEGQRKCILQCAEVPDAIVAGRGGRVIVRLDGTLSLERRRREREEAKLFVQTVTSEASSHSGFPCVTGGLCREAETDDT